MKSKNLLYLLIKSVVLFLIVGVLTISMGFLFISENPSDSSWNAFYKQKKNTIDFLFFGNSHLGNGLDLSIVNSKTKSKVYSLYGWGQTLPQTYYNVKEALKYQTPKLIVIETFVISEFSKNLFDKQERIPKIQSFDAKKFGYVKIEEFKDLYEKDGIDKFPAFITNHSNWSEEGLVVENLIEKLKPNPKSDYYFGCLNSTQILNRKKIKVYREKDFNKHKYNISEHQLSYFNKIVALAKEKDIEVLLVTIPFFKEYRKRIDYESMHNSMANLALENNINYIDFNRVYSGFDNTYFMDDVVRSNQHLNYKGDIAVSNYLSNYINKNYNFELNNANESLPEYFLYNNVNKESLENGDRFIGNLETINDTRELRFPIKQGDSSSVVIHGWMAIENRNSNLNEMFVALVKDNDFIYVNRADQLTINIREDVTKYFDKENNLYDTSGFHIIIDSRLLELGVYKLYMIIRNNKGELLLKNTSKVVELH